MDDRDEERPPYRIPEVSPRLNTSDQTTRHLILRGELDGYKLGKHLFIRRESVDRLLRSKREASK